MYFQGSPKEWNRILLLIAILCLISGVQFCIFGSGDIQDFAKRGMQKNQREDEILLKELCQKNIRADSLSILE
uniref:Uncharacterized protein n=1 Tax=Heterorhabditis bacteriophora TaxID=37862 RepID=A0A1I7WV36_HETBA